MEYDVTIGMEVHAELRTNTKMFCSSKNDPDEKHPNTNICPVCMGHPGTLPVINEAAVRAVQRVGIALGGTLQIFSRFDRKNYFYPDLPKGYQISQYQYPFVFGGMLNGIRITRVHLEEDTARLIHKGDDTLVDFNRAGVPLMELVTEPDIRDAKTARAFCEELQLVLQYLGASDANMEKGQMRCEANISIRPKGTEAFGTKVEIKNLNSFRAVERAIEYEIERQAKVLAAGEKVKQETRGWDEDKGHTFSQRSKESAHDYRYFPEPDLPPLEFSAEYFDELRSTIPELPAGRRKRFMEEYKLSEVFLEMLVRDPALGIFWEQCASELKEWFIPNGAGEEQEKSEEVMKLAANYFGSDLLGLIKEKEIPVSELLVEPENFAELIKMIVRKEISSRAAKDVLRHMVESGGDPSDIVRDKGLGQISDEGALAATIERIVAQNPNVIFGWTGDERNQGGWESGDNPNPLDKNNRRSIMGGAAVQGRKVGRQGVPLGTSRPS